LRGEPASTRISPPAVASIEPPPRRRSLGADRAGNPDRAVGRGAPDRAGGERHDAAVAARRAVDVEGGREALDEKLAGSRLDVDLAAEPADVLGPSGASAADPELTPLLDGGCGDEDLAARAAVAVEAARPHHGAGTDRHRATGTGVDVELTAPADTALDAHRPADGLAQVDVPGGLEPHEAALARATVDAAAAGEDVDVDGDGRRRVDEDRPAARARRRGEPVGDHPARGERDRAAGVKREGAAPEPSASGHTAAGDVDEGVGAAFLLEERVGLEATRGDGDVAAGCRGGALGENLGRCVDLESARLDGDRVGADEEAAAAGEHHVLHAEVEVAHRAGSGRGDVDHAVYGAGVPDAAGGELGSAARVRRADRVGTRRREEEGGEGDEPEGEATG
jgi:hypothetical protein